MSSVPSPAFAQPERRSFLVPVLLAIAVLAVAVAALFRLLPATHVEVSVVRTAIVPTRTVFKADSIMVGQSDTQNILFLAPTLQLSNGIPIPVTLEEATLTLTDKTDAVLTVRATNAADTEANETSFPQLRPLMTTPLLRDIPIAAKSTTEGTLLFSLPVPKDLWDARKSAVLKLDFYHQPSTTVTLPPTP